MMADEQTGLQKWLRKVGTTNLLGGTELFDNFVQAIHQDIALESVNTYESKGDSLTKKPFPQDLKQRLLTSQWMGYNHPRLNKIWQNQLVFDGYNLFIPESWLSQPSGTDKVSKAIDKLVKDGMQLTQSLEQTREQLEEANLKLIADKIFKSTATIPFKVLQRTWKEKTAIPKNYQLPFEQFFIQLKLISTPDKNLQPQINQLREKLINEFRNLWGEESSLTNHLAKFVVWEEWLRSNHATNWTGKDFLKHPETMEETWLLLGVLNTFCQNNVGLITLITYHIEQNDKLDGRQQMEEHRLWFQVIPNRMDIQGHSPATASRDAEYGERLNSCRQNILDLEAFRQPLTEKSAAYHLETVARLANRAMEKATMYVEKLREAGIKIDLNEIGRVSYNRQEQRMKIGRTFLWKYLLEEARSNFWCKFGGDNNLNIDNWLNQQAKIFDFYGTQGLALTGDEEREAIMGWVANPWAMEGIVNASKLPKFLAMELVKPILKTRGEMSSQAMLDLFINHNEMAYQRKITEHRLWVSVPTPTAGEKLTWLVNNGFINLEEISYDKKTDMLEKNRKVQGVNY